jgi:hypothetical protein
MDTNLVISIPGLAVIVSSITAAFSAFSIIKQIEYDKKQQEYNENTVKPICSVYLTNCANFISVRIENNGLGPAIIKNGGA